MGTTVEAAAGEPELYRRGCSYRIPGERVDGTDVLAVREAAQRALDRARLEREPALLEVMSYRLRGHSVVDPARYRSAADIETAQAADPLPMLRRDLIAAGMLDEAGARRIETDADATRWLPPSPSPIPARIPPPASSSTMPMPPPCPMPLRHCPGEPVVVLP